MISFFRIYCVLSLWLFCASLFAQNERKSFVSDTTSRTEPDLYLLDELIVVGKKNEKIIPSQSLAGEELQRLNSHSVADALRYFSGIQIKDYGGVGGLKTVDVRGMGSNHTGVFYDGIQLGNAQNGQVDLGKFSLDNMEEISLYNGHKSELLQSARDFGSAGSIYLRTRRPRFDNGKKTNLTALFRTGSFDLINPSFLWEQKLSPTVSTSLNAELIDSSGKYKFRYKRINPDGSPAWDTTAVRQNGDIQAFRLEGGINGYLDRGKWHAKAYYYNSERGIPGAIVNNVWKHAQRQWDENFFTQASFQKGLTDNYEILFNVKFAHDYMRFLNPEPTPRSFDNSFYQKEFYASLANRYKINPLWEASFSVDHQWNTLDANLPDFVYPTRNTTWISLATTFEWKQIKILASGLATFVQDTQEKQNIWNPQEMKDEYVPSVFLAYRPFPQTDFIIHSFYKRIFRMPTFNDLYYTEMINSRLDPEYVSQYDLGFQYKKKSDSFIPDFSLKADFYYNDVDNKIIVVLRGNSQLRGMFMNIGKAKIKGTEWSVSADYRVAEECLLRTNLNYTFQKALDYSDPSDNGDGGTYKGQIAYIPEHSGSFIASLLYRDWNLNYSFIYVGERYHASDNIRENHEQPWYTHDLSLGKPLRLKFANLKLSLEVNNLLNQHYDVVLNYPMPGRNFKLICKIEI